MSRSTHVLRCCHDPKVGVTNCPTVTFTDDEIVIMDPDQPHTPTVRLTRQQMRQLADLFEENEWTT